MGWFSFGNDDKERIAEEERRQADIKYKISDLEDKLRDLENEYRFADSQVSRHYPDLKDYVDGYTNVDFDYWTKKREDLSSSIHDVKIDIRWFENQL